MQRLFKASTGRLTLPRLRDLADRGDLERQVSELQRQLGQKKARAATARTRAATEGSAGAH